MSALEGTKHLFIRIMSPLPILILWKIPLILLSWQDLCLFRLMCSVFASCFKWVGGGHSQNSTTTLSKAPYLREYPQLGALLYTFERQNHKHYMSLKDNLLCKAWEGACSLFHVGSWNNYFEEGISWFLGPYYLGVRPLFLDN